VPRGSACRIATLSVPVNVLRFSPIDEILLCRAPIEPQGDRLLRGLRANVAGLDA
jgi:hypothetical protein